MQSNLHPPRVSHVHWWAQLLMAFVLLIASNRYVLAAPNHQSAVTATVTVGGLNVRSGPGTNYSRVGLVRNGEILTVVGQTRDCAWLKVLTPQEHEGWVSGATNHVKLDAPCSTIPAATVSVETPAVTPTATPTVRATQADSNKAAAVTATAEITETVAPTPTPAPTNTPNAAPAAASANTRGLSGRLLYSVANMDAKRWELWEYNFATGSSTNIADWRTEVDISRDGKQIAYFAWPSDAGEKAGIWIMDNNLSNNRLVVPGGAYPTFSPGGDRLAANSFSGDIWVFTTDAKNFRKLTRGEYPDWSPVSDEIVHRGCIGGDCGLWIIDANSQDANAKRRITTGGGDGQPAWSPDGSHVAYISKDDGNFELYVVNKDGSGKQRLTNEAASDGLPTWSPDGQWIAFRSDRGGQWAIYAMRPDGSDLRKITDANVLDHWFFEKMVWRN